MGLTKLIKNTNSITSYSLSLRVSNNSKTNLNNLATKANMNMSKFIITKIEQEYDYVKQMQTFTDICKLIEHIIDILNLIILDEFNNPYDEFNNDFLLYVFYEIKKLSINFHYDFSYFDIEYNGNKTEHISVRINCKINKKLKYITNFYNCKKSDIISLISLREKNNKIIPNVLKCLCYITDVKNYFYEKHMNFEDFERTYVTLWGKIK